MDFMSFSDSNKQSARSEDGVWGLVPRLGFGDEIPHRSLIAKRVRKSSQEAKRTLTVILRTTPFYLKFI